MGSNKKKEAMNQSPKSIQNEAKRIWATTFAIAKLEEQ